MIKVRQQTAQHAGTHRHQGALAGMESDGYCGGGFDQRMTSTPDGIEGGGNARWSSQRRVHTRRVQGTRTTDGQPPARAPEVDPGGWSHASFRPAPGHQPSLHRRLEDFARWADGLLEEAVGELLLDPETARRRLLDYASSGASEAWPRPPGGRCWGRPELRG